jgi:hypothetical protein
MFSIDSKESTSTETELLEFVELLEREISASQALEARLAKVFCSPSDGAGVSRVPYSYTADLCKADLRRRQGLSSINEAMRKLHRNLESMADPWTRKRIRSKDPPSRQRTRSKDPPSRPRTQSKDPPWRPRTVPTPADKHRAANPIADMTEAQHLLDAMRQICAAQVVNCDPEWLPDLICRSLEGNYIGAVDLEPRAPRIRSDRRASV